MLLTPLACTLPARFAILRIGRDLAPAVAGTALPLAFGLAAHGLRGLTFRGDEGFVAVRATPLDHRGVVAFSAGRDLEANLEYLPRPRSYVFACVDRSWSQWLRLTPAEVAPVFTGVDISAAGGFGDLAVM